MLEASITISLLLCLTLFIFIFFQVFLGQYHQGFFHFHRIGIWLGWSSPLHIWYPFLQFLFFILLFPSTFFELYFAIFFSSLLREILGSLIFNRSAFLRCTFKALHFLLEAQMEKIYLSGWSQIGTQKVSHHHHRSYYPVSVLLRLSNTVSSSLAF